MRKQGAGLRLSMHEIVRGCGLQHGVMVLALPLHLTLFDFGQGGGTFQVAVERVGFREQAVEEGTDE